VRKHEHQSDVLYLRGDRQKRGLGSLAVRRRLWLRWQLRLRELTTPL